MDKSVCQTLIIDKIVQSLTIREIGKFMLSNKRIFRAVEKSNKFKLVRDLHHLAKDKNTANKFLNKMSAHEKKWSLVEYCNLSTTVLHMFKAHPVFSTVASVIALISAPVIIPAISFWVISNKIKQHKDHKWYSDPTHAMLWVSCLDSKYISVTSELINRIQDKFDDKLLINLCQIAILNDNIELITLLGNNIKHLGKTDILMFGELSYYVANLKIADLILDLYKTKGYDLALWNEMSSSTLGMNNCGLLEKLKAESYNISQRFVDDAFLRACKNTDIKTLLFLTSNYNVDVRMDNDIAFVMACKTGNYEIGSVLSSLCKNYFLTTATEKSDKSYSYTKIDKGFLYMKYKII